MPSRRRVAAIAIVFTVLLALAARLNGLL